MSIGPAAGGFLASVSFPALFFVDGANAIAAGIVLFLSAARLQSGDEAPAGARGGSDRPRDQAPGPPIRPRSAWADPHLL